MTAKEVRDILLVILVRRVRISYVFVKDEHMEHRILAYKIDDNFHMKHQFVIGVYGLWGRDNTFMIETVIPNSPEFFTPFYIKVNEDNELEITDV